MKIVFLSNYLNHHQKPTCDAFAANPDVEFTFVATTPVPENRIKLGYKASFGDLPYYKEAITAKEQAEIEPLCFDADVVIIGSAPLSLVARRLKAKKLTFSYNERWFKNGFWRHPGDIFRMWKDYARYNNKNFYQLCASAYTAHDSNRVFAFPKRKLRWGYFPAVKQYDDVNKLIKSKHSASLLWCGRLIDWKHPEAALEVARRLKENGYSFDLNIIGTGELEESIRADIRKYRLEDRVHLLGAMSPEEVRKHMESSVVFLFTSDYGEGWGAVLNESMNSACVPIVSRAVGAAPYLVKDGENGYLYDFGDNDRLYDHVRQLLDEPQRAHRMGEAAYRTMTETWNADTAAARLYQFAKAILEGGQPPMFDVGPISYDHGKVKN